MPANDRAPSFQFYPRDFLADRAVDAMTPEELGGYIRLLCHAWETGGVLPNDDDLLARYSRLGDRWPECSKMVRAAFLDEGDHLVQRRMSAERREQRKRYEQAKKGAAITNDKRWGSVAQRPDSESLFGRPAVTPASSFAFASKSKDLRLSGADAHFDAFWKAWPKGRKKSKQAALKAWKQLKPTKTLIHRIMAGLAEAKASKEWAGELRFIPYPATWLNAGGWDDDYEPLVQSVAAGPSFRDEVAAILEKQTILQPRSKAEVETLAATIHQRRPEWSAGHVVQEAVNMHARKRFDELGARK